MTTGFVNMATTYNRVAHLSPSYIAMGFPTDWKFDSSTKIWLGGGPLSTKRYEMNTEKISTWAGYLPFPSTYPGALLLGHFRIILLKRVFMIFSYIDWRL